MQPLYLVVDGEYSDYTVYAAYLARDQAEAVCAAIHAMSREVYHYPFYDARVEMIPLDPEAVDVLAEVFHHEPAQAAQFASYQARQRAIGIERSDA